MNAALIRRWRQSSTSVFAPGALFANGEDGAWYDPSDLTTLFQDVAGTTPVTTAGQTVALMLDKSGNDNHATQATAAARPTYGIVPATGRRNKLTYTEDFSNAVWLKGAVTVSGADIIEDTSSGFHRLNQDFEATSSQQYTISFTVKANGRSKVAIRRTDAGALPAPSTHQFNLSDGTIIGSSWDGLAIVDEGGGIYRISATVTADTTGTATPALFLMDDSGNLSYAGDGSSGVTLYNTQIEEGPTANDYQKVVSQYEVTEAGVASRFYIEDDGIDDVLNSTLPDLGTDATVAYVSDQGVTIQTGQTIGAGSFDILRDSQLFGMIVIDRALTAAETARVTTYLEGKGIDT